MQTEPPKIGPGQEGEARDAVVLGGRNRTEESTEAVANQGHAIRVRPVRRRPLLTPRSLYGLRYVLKRVSD